MDARTARFDALLAEHRGIVAKVARVYERGVEERRDLEQEIATHLWRAFPRFDPALAKFSTWMFRVALNVAISHLRHARVFEPLDEKAHAQTAVADDDRIEALYEQIRALEPLNRALVLLYLEDRSYAEIAEVLGISEANVATKLSRIKSRLRERLEQQGRQRPMLAGRIRIWASFAGWTAMVIVGAAFWSAHLGSPYFFAAGLAVHGYGVVAIILGAVQLRAIARIDYGGSVLAVQPQLARVARLRAQCSLALGLPWWVLWVPCVIVATGIHHALWAASSIAVGLVGLAITATRCRRR